MQVITKRFIILLLLITGYMLFLNSQIMAQHQEVDQVEFTVNNKVINQPDSLTIISDSRYEAKGFWQFLMGSHYRDLWTMPVKLPVLNLQQFEGGVDAYHFTGGQQSTTFFARTEEGGHYVFRSVQKNPVVFAEDQDDPEQIMFNNSVIRDVLQDQISSSHPYGPLTLMPILKASGLYYSDHSLFYLHKQAGSEEFPETGVNTPVMKENFASLDYLKQFDSNVEDVISTADLITYMLEDGEYSVDAEWYLRARLIDILVGDWDRHEGQFLWAITSDYKQKVARTYQLDHDGAYFVMTGLLPSLGTRARPLRKFQHFDEDIRELAGLNEQARYMDEIFLNRLPERRWSAVAEDLQKRISDKVLQKAVSRLPDEIYRLDGHQLLSKLKSRRDKLPVYAMEFYDRIARDLDITGTVADNLFRLTESEDGNLSISVYSSTEGSSLNLIFERVIKADETRSVRLFGIEGENRYEFNYPGDLPITVHIVDLNEQRVIEYTGNASGKNIKVHTTSPEFPDDFQFKFNTRDFTEDLVQKYGYNYQEADDDLFEIIPSFRLNSDDGLILGGGVAFTTYRFRRYPYATRQQLVARLATRTTGYTIDYNGEFINVTGSADLDLNMYIQAPNFSNNFFGLGNETGADRSSNFFDVRRDIYGIDAELKFDLTRELNIGTALTFEAVKLDVGLDKFFLTPEAGLADDDFDTHSILGFRSSARYNIGDTGFFPRNRFQIESAVHITHNFLDSNTMLTLNGSVVGSRSIFHRNLVVASRVGAATNIGDFRFFQANTLGDAGSFLRSNRGFFEAANFRGVPRDRFSGRSVFYQNTELRSKLFEFNNYFAPGDFGVIALFDHGRVWAPGESSDVWHYAYGGGVWYNFYKNFLISSTYAISDVDSNISVLFGFMF
jgi:hypothetical protein